MNKLLLFSVIISSVIGIISCTEEGVNNPIGNQPPNTGLFLFPDSTILPQQSRLRVHWWGDDPDGLIVGYYFSWDNILWEFTPSNDSLFALQIGANDTTFTFHVSAVDNGGNIVYDDRVFQNGIDFGPEPFVDENDNGVYDEGEFFYDIGLIDPTPAEFDFPLRNSAPTIEWNDLSFLPDTSFPVMSFSWVVEDIDGEESIVAINIAMNDTTNPANIIALDGGVRIVTLRTDDFSTSNPFMEILIEAQEGNIHPELLPGLVLDADNKFYVQAVDISGAKSKFIALPDSGESWYVKKPSGNLLIIDDYATNDNTAAFYTAMFDSLGLTGSYDVYDIHTQEPPFLNVTFLETIKLFDFLFWYTDNFPSLDLASFATQKYLTQGGKVAFSMQFPQSIDPLEVSSFIPIIPDSIDTRVSLLPGTEVVSDTTDPVYPNLETTSSIFRVKSFYLNPLVANPIYYYPNGELKGFTGFTNTGLTEFFIALPLHKCNGGAGNVKSLLEKIFFEDFGLSP
ncbi:MAG: hypothetical protein IH852_16990 [Bacteroidetes bacterium]|nr:hypothetical protein [Bacteroidota bacterium]